MGLPWALGTSAPAHPPISTSSTHSADCVEPSSTELLYSFPSANSLSAAQDVGRGGSVQLKQSSRPAFAASTPVLSASPCPLLITRCDSAQCVYIHVHWTVFPPRPSEVGHTVQSHNCHIFVPIRSVKGKLTKSDFCESQTSNSKCNFPQIFPNYSPNSNGVFSATTGVFVGVFEPGREKTIHTIQWLVNTLSTG